jgi:GxxExxY protein
LHPKYKRADAWTREVIGSAIEVHREKGPGLIESIYEKCLMRELELRRIPAQTQVVVPVEYKGYVFEEPLKLDVYVDSCLILELKAVEQVFPIHEAQLLSYMKLMNAPIGLLMNFHEIVLHKGIRRFLLKGAADE